MNHGRVTDVQTFILVQIIDFSGIQAMNLNFFYST